MRIPGRPLNPVLARELKERLRTRRTTVVVTVYLAVLAVILQIVYQALSSSPSDGFSGTLVATQTARLGRSLFETLLFFMLLLVCFIVPGLTADAITGERERQTLVPLQVSLLSPRSIVAGKLLSSLAFVALLVFATLPLLGVSFILGGVSVGQMVRGVAVVLASGLVVACVALACSSLTRRTQAAMVLAYAATLFLTLGSAMIYGAQAVLDNSVEPHRPPVAVLTLNPFFAAAAATGEATFDGSITSPLAPMRSLLAQINRNDQFGRGFDGGFAGPGRVVVGGPFPGPPPPPGLVAPPLPTVQSDEPLPTPEGFVSVAPAPEGFVSVAPVPGQGFVSVAPVPGQGFVSVAPAPEGFVSVAPVPGQGFVSVAPGFPGDFGGAQAEDDGGVPFWAWSALSLGTVAVAGFVIATRRLRTPSVRAAA